MYELRINRLRRFLHWLVLALALGAVGQANAFPAVPTYSASFGVCGGIYTPPYSSPAAAASALAVLLNEPSCGWGGGALVGSMDGPQCRLSAPNGAAFNCTISAIGAACPANSTGTTDCTCTPPAVENATHDGCSVSNPDDERCKAIKTIQDSTLGGSTESVAPGQMSSGFACNTNVSGVSAGRGCGVQIQVTMQGKDRVTGNWSTYFTMRPTGSSCTPDLTATDTSPTESTSTAPPTTPNNNPCPPGKSAGTATMNGTTVTTCTDPIETKSEPTKETVKQNPGTPEETTSETTTETKCTGNSCNTTTTVTNTTVNGSTTSSSSSKTEGKDAFCAKNPKDGNCTGTGDAGCSKGGGTAGCTGLGKPSDGELPTEEIDVNTFAPDNMSGFNIGNGCPADMDFQAFGKNFKLSYKPFCDVAPFVKPVVLLSAALAALMIVYAALTTKN